MTENILNVMFALLLVATLLLSAFLIPFVVENNHFSSVTPSITDHEIRAVISSI